MKFLVIVLTILSSALLVNAQKVRVTADPSVDLTSYKTYGWVVQKGSANPLIHQTIVDAIDRALAAKGLRKSDVDAEITVSVMAATEYDMHTSYPSWSPGLNSINTGIVVGTQGWPVTKGTLLVDISDAKTKNNLWRGIATDTLEQGPSGSMTKDAKNVEKVINKAVVKMFKQYPRPKS